jgi:hypothetical protein
MRIGIDGSLIGTLQRQLLKSEVSRCAFLAEQKLQQKHQDSRPYPEPRALPLPYQEHIAAGSMAIGATRSWLYL